MPRLNAQALATRVPERAADADIVKSTEVASETTIKIVFKPSATVEQMRKYLDSEWPSPEYNDKLFGHIALVFANPYDCDESDDESDDEDDYSDEASDSE